MVAVGICVSGAGKAVRPYHYNSVFSLSCKRLEKNCLQIGHMIKYSGLTISFD